MRRILGLDVGERRIGVALSDPLGLTAQRLTVLQRRDPVTDFKTIAALAADHHAEAIIVGLPLTMQGVVGTQATRIMAFVEQLRAHVRCPVHVVDERLTTVEGERALLATDASRRKRKQLIDQVAAQLILQAYLDAHASRS
jgi:putative Holliday junction resolvase